MNKQTTAKKTTWFIIFFAFVTSVGVYGLLCFIIQQSKSPPQPQSILPTVRPILYAAAGVCLLASIVWMHLKSQGKAKMVGEPLTLPSPDEFQTATITALSLADTCAPFGLLLFFLGAPIAEFARFAVASVVVMLFFILPKGMGYWTEWEMHQQSGNKSFK
jgi:hypothetical protein